MKQEVKKQALSTESYKGVRDFYPEDLAIQRYIFDTWAKTAESFGFERYDASVLEPSELYKAKGAQNEEMVNEQTYTFIDKGDREVTLRPEMTPTVARMVAGKRRELTFPLRWYSIPNLFRYERPQRGRVREHWQLNADIFGSNSEMADVEIILLASAILKGFGAKVKGSDAKESDFEIVINARKIIPEIIRAILRRENFDAIDEEIGKFTRLLDRRNKMPQDDFDTQCIQIFGEARAKIVKANFYNAEAGNLTEIMAELESVRDLILLTEKLKVLGVNVRHDSELARGFDYYTGTIFEIFDTNPDNRRSLLGGGRYDNLTGLFGGDPIPAVGFGMGDVTMRDFLETHDLLPKNLQTIDIALIPMKQEYALEAEKIAQTIRTAGKKAYVSLADKKVGDHIKQAEARNAQSIIVIGEEEITSGIFTLKTLASGSEIKGTISDLLK